MKKIFLSLTVILAFVIYSIYHRFEDSDKTRGETSTIASPAPEVDSVPATQSNPKKQYKSGQFTGDVTNAYYGKMQVKAVITDGKITDVEFLQYPKDRQTSIDINTQAMPRLREEAISIQNSNVDIVTGATQSSRAFRQALQSALDKAI